jgi:hypothetical protein
MRSVRIRRLARLQLGAGLAGALMVLFLQWVWTPTVAFASTHIKPLITGTIAYTDSVSGPIIEGIQNGSGIGVEGVTNTGAPAGAIALDGFGTSSTAASVGVNGSVDGPGSTALIGNANDASGSASIGLEGFSANGEGVFAESTSSSFASLRSVDSNVHFDVRLSDTPEGNGMTAFLNSSTDGAAVEGDDTVTSIDFNIGVLGKTDNGDYGVEGTAANTGVAGVYGLSTASSGQEYGVEGVSVNGSGVYGVSTPGVGVQGSSADSNGVSGTSANSDGTDGFTTNPSASQAGRSGVYGLDSSSDGGNGNFGVTGQSADGDGVQGNSTDQFGVYGTSEFYSGVYGFSEDDVGTWGYGVFGVVGQCDSGGDDEFYGQNSSDENNFTVDCNGTASVIARSRHGLDADPTFEMSAQSVIEDYGEAQMVNGAAHVALDPSFADTITSSSPYLVFVTPDADTKGLYVTNKTMTGFDVRESSGGRSNLAFDYRIVAHLANGHYDRMALTAHRSGLSVRPGVLARNHEAPVEIAHRLAAFRAAQTRQAAAARKQRLSDAVRRHALTRLPIYEPRMGADGRLHPGQPYHPQPQG